MNLIKEWEIVMLDVFFSPEPSAREVMFTSLLWLGMIAVVVGNFISPKRAIIACLTAAVLSFIGAFYVLVGHERWVMAWQAESESFLIGFCGMILLVANQVFRKRLIKLPQRFKCLYGTLASDLYYSAGSISCLISFGAIAMTFMQM